MHVEPFKTNKRAIQYAHLDERLDLAPLRKLLSTHTLGDLQWVTLDASNDGVGEGPFLGALIELLDHDDLLACLTAGEHDGNLYTTLLIQTSTSSQNQGP